MFDFQDQLFSKVNISDGSIVTIDPSLPVSQCADDYARKLKQVHSCLSKLLSFRNRSRSFVIIESY